MLWSRRISQLTFVEWLVGACRRFAGMCDAVGNRVWDLPTRVRSTNFVMPWPPYGKYQAMRLFPAVSSILFWASCSSFYRTLNRLSRAKKNANHS